MARRISEPQTTHIASCVQKHIHTRTYISGVLRGGAADVGDGIASVSVWVVNLAPSRKWTKLSDAKRDDDDDTICMRSEPTLWIVTEAAAHNHATTIHVASSASLTSSSSSSSRTTRPCFSLKPYACCCLRNNVPTTHTHTHTTYHTPIDDQTKSKPSRRRLEKFFVVGRSAGRLCSVFLVIHGHGCGVRDVWVCAFWYAGDGGALKWWCGGPCFVIVVTHRAADYDDEDDATAATLLLICAHTQRGIRETVFAGRRKWEGARWLFCSHLCYGYVMTVCVWCARSGWGSRSTRNCCAFFMRIGRAEICKQNAIIYKSYMVFTTTTTTRHMSACVFILYELLLSVHGTRSICDMRRVVLFAILFNI